MYTQVVAQYPCTKNAHSEKVTAQMSVAAENAGDGLVVVFWHVVRQVGTSGAGRDGEERADLPFLATMFHAVGLNAMDARER
jgi:hypothetical protein